MSDEGRVHASVAVELFFEGKNYKCFVDVVAEQAHASLPPGPELRGDVIDGGNTSFFHLPSYAPVEGRGVDDDGEVGLAAVSLADQILVELPDFWQVAEDF